jgi:lipoprotein NlpD
MLVALCLVACQTQPPARVVAAKPTIKRLAIKNQKRVPKNIAQPRARPESEKVPLQLAIAKKPLVVGSSKTSKQEKALNWSWPARGSILTNFASGQTTFKGIDIAGSEGAAVLAAAEGEVVYSGNSLRGYGNLIIIKHQKNFLSAYAHNRKNMVKEGDRVIIGQKIAEMGQTGTDRVKLHFEVRHHGKPVDPQGVLPTR